MNKMEFYNKQIVPKAIGQYKFKKITRLSSLHHHATP
jgi:hypothetical protein